MNRSLRYGTALSALVMAAALPGCATGKNQQSVQAANVSAGKVGLATRALAAMNANDFGAAVNFAEQAVEHSPGQAAFRSVLGNAYFGSGRFASAESAYRDSLSLNANQPGVVLKLALAQIAQGKSEQALGALESARDYLEAADYGLAVALAGRPADAVAVLGQAARLPGADSRVRQNLALAHALAGDWTMARTIAAQDVPAEQLDSRIQQWMAMATPVRASDQVAALTGITPSVDAGQPVRLALNNAQPAQPAQRVAEAAPAAVQPLPVHYAEPEPLPVHYAEPEPVQYIEPRPRAPEAPVLAELPQAVAPAMPTVAEVVQADPPQPVRVVAALIEPAVHVADSVAEAAPAALPASFEAEADVAKYVPIKARKAVPVTGRSNSVVQLGAYGSPERVAAAWDQVARKYASLSRYTPVSARFNSPKGVVYRLSVKGFATADEAQRLCGSLKQKGKACFVRRVAGDAPVRFASR